MLYTKGYHLRSFSRLRLNFPFNLVIPPLTYPKFSEAKVFSNTKRSPYDVFWHCATKKLISAFLHTKKFRKRKNLKSSTYHCYANMKHQNSELLFVVVIFMKKNTIQNTKASPYKYYEHYGRRRIWPFLAS